MALLTPVEPRMHNASRVLSFPIIRHTNRHFNVTTSDTARDASQIWDKKNISLIDVRRPKVQNQ